MKFPCFLYSLLISSLLISGCRTQEPAEANMGEVYQQRAEVIIAGGGFAAAGIGASRNMERALDIARKRCSQRIASSVGGRIEMLRRDFTLEIGADNISKFDVIFDAASRIVVSEHLEKIVPQDSDSKTEAGITTAYTIMVIDPVIIVNAFTAQAASQRHLFIRLKASNAFAALSKQASKYAEHKASTVHSP